MASLGFYMYRIISLANYGSFTSSVWMLFILSPCLITMAMFLGEMFLLLPIEVMLGISLVYKSLISFQSLS